jgi:SAM-dependent methyltransferase
MTPIGGRGVTTPDAKLLDEWRQAYQAPVTGWDFSELDGRYVDQQPPWVYHDLAHEVLAHAASALDMGTGGGEVLLELVDALPGDTVATEGWAPNIPVATRNLAAHGIPVVAYDAEADPAMPFPDRRFDVVLNRHEAYVASEVHRVLRPGGCFLTQQVDGRDFEETQVIFGGTSEYPHITLANLRAEAEAAGLEVTASEEWQGETRFADVAALVRYFAFVPWEVPEDFDVDRYADELLDLHHSGPDLVFTRRRFYLRAHRRQ